MDISDMTLKKLKKIFYVLWCLAYMCVFVRVSGSLELELQSGAIMWVLGTDPKASGRAAIALHHLDISPILKTP